MYNRIKEKIPLFWLLQISGWGLYFAFDFFAFIFPAKSSIYYFVSGFGFFIIFFSAYFVAFLLTIAFRYFYRKIDFQSMSLSYIFIKILISSIVAAQIIIIISELVKHNIIFNSQLTLAHLFRDNMEPLFRWSTPLLGWSMLYFSIKFLTAWRVQKEKTETKVIMVENAQVEMLKYQIDPDFLFGSLENIKELVPVDKESAKTTVNDLSEYLRYILLSSKVDNVPLSNEIEAVKHYLDIECKRYNGRLSYDLKSDQSVEESPVMSMLILQIVRILISGLFEIGLEQLNIIITAGKQEDWLRIESIITVPDGNFKKFKIDNFKSKFKEIEERLFNRYSEHQKFTISADDDHLRVNLSLW
ncbi:MAG: hypothetical protein GY863_04215 [bacterium]|nr:hypothetical protein [bacterium]